MTNFSYKRGSKRSSEPFITFYVVCSHPEIAMTIAKMSIPFRIPNIYASDKLCYLAWEDQPNVMKRRYFPYRVTMTPEGEILSCNQIPESAKHETGPFSKKTKNSSRDNRG